MLRFSVLFNKLGFLIIVFAFNTSCQVLYNMETGHDDKTSQMELKVIMNSFKKDLYYNKFPKPILNLQSVRFVKNPNCGGNKKVSGCCHRLERTGNITLNYQDWLLYNYKYKMALVYHELLHCLYNVKHQDHTLMDPQLNKAINHIESRTESNFLTKLRGALNDFKPKKDR